MNNRDDEKEPRKRVIQRMEGSVTGTQTQDKHHAQGLGTRPKHVT